MSQLEIWPVVFSVHALELKFIELLKRFILENMQLQSWMPAWLYHGFFSAQNC
jgi:hypothetical protein